MISFKSFLFEDDYDPEEAIRKAREVSRRQSKAQITGQNTRALIRQRKKEEEKRIQRRLEKLEMSDQQSLNLKGISNKTRGRYAPNTGKTAWNAGKKFINGKWV